MTTQQLNDLSSQVIAAAIEVHRVLGPGLLEGVYEECLAEELRATGHTVQRQVPVSIQYKGKSIGERLYIDILVDQSLIIELKAVRELQDIHLAQTLTYLRLTGHRLALLINFNVPRLIDGLRRVVNNL